MFKLEETTRDDFDYYGYVETTEIRVTKMDPSKYWDRQFFLLNVQELVQPRATLEDLRSRIADGSLR